MKVWMDCTTRLKTRITTTIAIRMSKSARFGMIPPFWLGQPTEGWGLSNVMALHDHGRGLRLTQTPSVPSVHCAWFFLTGSVKNRLAVASAHCSARKEHDAQ